MVNLVTRNGGNLASKTVVGETLEVRTMDDLSRLSQMLSSSGYFKDAKDAAQCGVKVLAGLEMGFGAFASMTGIHIIQGKPEVGANLLASAIKRHPNYNYRVLEHSDTKCAIAFYERWEGRMEQVGISEFTIEDAQAAGTQNIKKYPRNMLFARALTNGVKWYCPDVTAAPVYAEGESEDGQMPPPMHKDYTSFETTQEWCNWLQMVREASDRDSLIPLQNAAYGYIDEGILQPRTAVENAIAHAIEAAEARLSCVYTEVQKAIANDIKAKVITYTPDQITMATRVGKLAEQCQSERISIPALIKEQGFPSDRHLFTEEQIKTFERLINQELDKRTVNV